MKQCKMNNVASSRIISLVISCAVSCHLMSRLGLECKNFRSGTCTKAALDPYTRIGPRCRLSASIGFFIIQIE